MTGYEVLAALAIILALVLGMVLLPTSAFWVLYVACVIVAALLVTGMVVRSLRRRGL